jgi:hypothetical protein
LDCAQCRRIQVNSVDSVSSAQFKFKHVLSENRYIPGKLYGSELFMMLAQASSVAGIIEWMRRWLDFLQAHALPANELGTGYSRSWRWLPGNFVDCNPFNLITDSHGCLHYIDAEWHCIDPIPLPWVLARGLVYSIRLCPTPSAALSVTYRDLLEEVFTNLAIEPTDELFTVVTQYENDLMDVIFTDRERRGLDFTTVLSQPIVSGLSDRQYESPEDFRQVQKTLGWRLLMLYWRTVERWFPRGSRRRDMLDSLADFCRRFIARMSMTVER